MGLPKNKTCQNTFHFLALSHSFSDPTFEILDNPQQINFPWTCLCLRQLSWKFWRNRWKKFFGRWPKNETCFWNTFYFFPVSEKKIFSDLAQIFRKVSSSIDKSRDRLFAGEYQRFRKLGPQNCGSRPKNKTCFDTFCFLGSPPPNFQSFQYFWPLRGSTWSEWLGASFCKVTEIFEDIGPKNENSRKKKRVEKKNVC